MIVRITRVKVGHRQAIYTKPPCSKKRQGGFAFSLNGRGKSRRKVCCEVKVVMIVPD